MLEKVKKIEMFLLYQSIHMQRLIRTTNNKQWHQFKDNHHLGLTRAV